MVRKKIHLLFLNLCEILKTSYFVERRWGSTKFHNNCGWKRFSLRTFLETFFLVFLYQTMLVLINSFMGNHLSTVLFVSSGVSAFLIFAATWITRWIPSLWYVFSLATMRSIKVLGAFTHPQDEFISVGMFCLMRVSSLILIYAISSSPRLHRLCFRLGDLM